MKTEIWNFEILKFNFFFFFNLKILKFFENFTNSVKFAYSLFQEPEVYNANLYRAYALYKYLYKGTCPVYVPGINLYWFCINVRLKNMLSY